MPNRLNLRILLCPFLEHFHDEKGPTMRVVAKGPAQHLHNVSHVWASSSKNHKANIILNFNIHSSHSIGGVQGLLYSAHSD